MYNKASKPFVDTELSKKLNLTGGDLSGPLTTSSEIFQAKAPSTSSSLINKAYIDNQLLSYPKIKTVYGTFLPESKGKPRTVVLFDNMSFRVGWDKLLPAVCQIINFCIRSTNNYWRDISTLNQYER